MPNQMARSAIAAAAAVTQKRTRQLANWATAAATGRPSAPPMPIEELISAIAEPARSLGRRSWMREIPSGIRPEASPWSPRPRIIGSTSVETAQITEPTRNGARATSIIGFLPYMSASRPATGVETAPVNKVTVMIHEAVAGDVPKMSGSAPMIGTTSVCARETVMPVPARIPTISPGGGETAGSPVLWGVSAKTIRA